MKVADLFNALKTPAILKRSFIIASIVGPILILINQGHFLFGDISQFDMTRAVLTFFVPFCVSALGAALNACNEGGTESENH